MTRPNQGLSSLAPGGGKMRDPGNKVGVTTLSELSIALSSALSEIVFFKILLYKTTLFTPLTLQYLIYSALFKSL